MSDIQVMISPDGLKASVMVSGNRINTYPTIAEFIDNLRLRGVCFGIDEDAIHRMITAHVCSRQMEVARGTPSTVGEHARIDMLVDISGVGRPKELDNGSVDHRDLHFVINVEIGSPLARRIPPQPGSSGKTVTGQPIPPPPVNDMKIYAGTGTSFAPNNSDLLLAKIAGGLSLTPDGRIEVRDQKEIVQDIDYATGNISFNGDLYIKGAIRAGFSVEATGLVCVTGFVEDARVKSGGDCIVSGGAVSSGSGIIEAGGSIKLRHVENFTVKSRANITIIEDAMNCTISAEGVVVAKTIVGGTVTVGTSVQADAIGSIAESRTVIDISLRFVRIIERYDLLRLLAKEITTLAGFKCQMYTIVKDSMNEAGELSKESINALDLLRKKKVESIEVCKKLQEKVEYIDKLEDSKVAPIVEAKMIFPNTLIKYGEGEKLIMELMQNVMYTPPATKGMP